MGVTNPEPVLDMNEKMRQLVGRRWGNQRAARLARELTDRAEVPAEDRTALVEALREARP